VGGECVSGRKKCAYCFYYVGGDSKTLMVVQVAPVEKNVAETVCSLTFAQRVRAVELGQASKKIIAPPSAERTREWEMVSSVVEYVCRSHKLNLLCVLI